MPETTKNSLSDDILDGADAIAEFLYGDPGKRRRVYLLAENGALPTFKLAGRVHARKSTLLDFIRRQEAEALSEAN